MIFDRSACLTTCLAGALALGIGVASAQDADEADTNEVDAEAEAPPPAETDSPTATAILEGDGIEGTVNIVEGPTGIVVIEVEATGFEPGPHGVHLHEVGSCDEASGHESAGGHIHGDREHGVLNPNGPHPGDLPNAFASEDGTIHAEFFAYDISIAGEADVVLMDDDGSAFIIHGDADDHMTDPTGNAGDRIACGVIEAEL